MIIRLLNIQFARLKRQKIVYLFFVVMAVIIISNALQEDNGMGYDKKPKDSAAFLSSLSSFCCGVM